MHTKPIEIAMITFHAVGLITGSDPYTDRAKDGRPVLMCGPRVAAAWPSLTPAEESAHRDGSPIVKLTVRQLLTVAAGGVVDTTTHQGEAARVRLATRIEAMVANRQARGDMPREEFPPPLDAASAAEMVAPVTLPDYERRLLLERFEGPRRRKVG